MGTSTLTSNPGSSGIPAPPGRKWRSSDLTLYVLLAALTYGAWWLSGRGYYRSGDRVGYWLGVTGGSMLLVLLLYPLRKYLRFMQRWGKVKWWFVGHMVLGIGGPLLILLHSTFSLRSANASVALISMLIVAISGVVGRFLYLRVHRGLQGQRDNLVDLQRKAGFAEGEVRSRFRFAPEVAERLLAFEASALQEDAGWWALGSRVVILPLRQRWIYRACAHDLDKRFRQIAEERRLNRDQVRRRRRQARGITRNFLLSVVRVAQFTAYERLFSMWHVLHLPFVYLLALTAGFHIFAVHAY
ncbi:MAG: hypothetical protein M3O01_01345 [Pseudomonadota bacterium]|nr:hypothetical protein [Pseudomonadota bacterium]